MPDSPSADHAPPETDLYTQSALEHREPPTTLRGTLRYLGPGLILAGSIVGSGELIMTTKLGAQAGFTLLWFVIFSCAIKVIVQGELVRYIISSGETVLEAFNKLPGPHWRRPEWCSPAWLASVIVISLAAITFYLKSPRGPAMALAVLAGGLTVSAGSAAAIRLRSMAIGRIDTWAHGAPRPTINWFMWIFLVCQMGMFINGGAILGGAGQALELAMPGLWGQSGARYWAVLVAAACAALLLGGRYALVERVSVGLVAGFTLVTVVCTILLQWTGYGVSADDLAQGLSFQFPWPLGSALLLTALAVYAGTGIGYWEMLAYTYWCIEKGYARHPGASAPGDAWPRRARGWVRVMYVDSWLTMVVYTLSTVCFYLLGAAILHRDQLDPEGIETLSVLQRVYTSALGDWAATLFVVGAFVVLFSTLVSGTAAGSRILADALSVLGFVERSDYAARLRTIRIMIVLSLALHGYAYYLFEDPPLMLMITGLLAVFMYPTLGLGTLYLRYRGVDRRIRPGRLATLLLWSCGLLVALVSPLVTLVMVAIELGWNPW